jgi:hypothetical protein
VNGKDKTLYARAVEITVANFPDYVFDSCYSKPSLNELDQYISTNHHLPEFPTATEVENNGLNIGDTQLLLVKKVEEITLYLIELKKKNELLQEEINLLKQRK